MSRHVLLIEQPSRSFASTVEAAIPAAVDLRLESIEWSAHLPDRLSRCTSDLILPVVAPQSPCALAFFQWLRERPHGPPVVAVLSDECPADLMLAATETTDDFLLSPVRTEELRRRVGRILGEGWTTTAAVRTALLEQAGIARLVGRAPVFLDALQKLPAIARSGRSVIITGETGTGKEICARAVHHLSARRNFPFIAVDCGAVPEHLFENELFGHARGAFTDARSDQVGLIAMAQGGTLFLDEVDALSLAAQGKLLRFLQDRSYRPLGGDRFVLADLAVIAATNSNLDALVRERRFRSDLYFRLNVIGLHLPPLRERRDDIPILARHFLDTLAAEMRCGRKTLTPPALRRLALYDWPGNVRELFNVLQAAVVFADGSLVRPEHLPVLGPAPAISVPASAGLQHARAEVVAAFERQYVEELMYRSGGNVTRAAAAAQKDRRAFGRLVKKYGIDRTKVQSGR